MVDEDFSDSDSAVQVIGTDDVAVLEDQLAFPRTACEPQNARFPGRVEQLYDIDNRRVFELSDKRPRAVSSFVGKEGQYYFGQRILR